MRSIWKGAVSFGLVSIGVKMYTATEEKDVSFHQVRRTDGSRVRYKRVAEADGEEVAYGDIAKGYVLPNGETVILTDEDFADLPLPTAHVVDVLQFVPLEQVDPIYFARSYYLEPEQQAVKPYVLLRDALESSGMVGLVKVAIRNREQLATLRVREGVIVMETMVWPDELREPAFAFLEQDVDLRSQERAMAESLVTSMSGDFEPEQYSDDYRAALQQVIDAKVEGREVLDTGVTETPSGSNVVDLMAALRASVDAAKRGRGEQSASARSVATANGTAKGAAKKSAASKSAASKSTPAPASTSAKKTPAKKAAKKVPARATASRATAPASAKAASRRRSA